MDYAPTHLAVWPLVLATVEYDAPFGRTAECLTWRGVIGVSLKEFAVCALKACVV